MDSFNKDLYSCYREIMSQVDEIIPDEWYEFYLDAEVTEGSRAGYFYFSTVSDPETFLYSHRIPEIYGVSAEIYSSLIFKLYDTFKKIYDVFLENEQPVFKTMVMKGNHNRSLDVDYSYIDWQNSEFDDVDRVTYFEYKHLNKRFANEYRIERLKRMIQYEQKNTENKQ